MIACVAFDFDGTLVDSNPVKIQAFYDIAKSYDSSGLIVSKLMRQNPGADRYDLTREMARHFQAHHLLPHQTNLEQFATQLAQAYTETCEALIATCQEIPGTSELLNWLYSQKIPIFLNSRTPLAPLRRLIALRSLDHFFSGVYGAPQSKSENLRSILQRVRVQPEEMIFVGDTQEDRLAATELGCVFVGVMFGSENRFTGKPERQVTDLHELQQLLMEEMTKSPKSGVS